MNYQKIFAMGVALGVGVCQAGQLAPAADAGVKCCGSRVMITKEHKEKCSELNKPKSTVSVGDEYTFFDMSCALGSPRASNPTAPTGLSASQKQVKPVGPDEANVRSENTVNLGKIKSTKIGSIPLPDATSDVMRMILYQPTIGFAGAKLVPQEFRFIFQMINKQVVIWEKLNQLEQKKMVGKNVPGVEGAWKKIAEIPQSAFFGAAELVIQYSVAPNGGFAFNLGKATVSDTGSGNVNVDMGESKISVKFGSN